MYQTSTINNMLKKIREEVKEGVLDEKYISLKKGPYRVSSEKENEPFYYHNNPNCKFESIIYSNPNLHVHKTITKGYNFKYCGICCINDLDVESLQVLHALSTYSKVLRETLTLKSATTDSVSRKITRINEVSWLAKNAVEKFSKIAFKLQKSVNSKKSVKEFQDYFSNVHSLLQEKETESVKHVKSLVNANEAKKELEAKAKNFLNASLTNGYFNEELVLVGTVGVKAISSISKIHDVYALKSNNKFTVSLMPHYVYEYYQRLIFKNNSHIFWVGYVGDVESLSKTVIDTAANLWDPLSKGTLESLKDALEIAKNV